MFFWNSLAFFMTQWMLAIWSLVPLPFLKWSEVAQLCLTLCDPMDCSLPGFFVHGIFQARILKWVAFSFSRGSSWLRDWTQVSLIAGRRFTLWATFSTFQWYKSNTHSVGNVLWILIFSQASDIQYGTLSWCISSGNKLQPPVNQAITSHWGETTHTLKPFFHFKHRIQ